LPRTGGTACSSGISWVMSLRLPPVKVAASRMPVASVIRRCLLPVLPRSTGLRPVLAPPLTPGYGSRRPPPGRSPGRSACGVRRGEPRGAEATHRPRSTRPGDASRSYPNRSRVPAAGAPRRSRYAGRTGCPGTPTGQDAACVPDAGSDAPPWAAAARVTGYPASPADLRIPSAWLPRAGESDLTLV
jgi:hypothetical protein